MWSLKAPLCVFFSGAPSGDGGRGQGDPGGYDQTLQESQSHLQHRQQTAGQEPQAFRHHEGGKRESAVSPLSKAGVLRDEIEIVF